MKPILNTLKHRVAGRIHTLNRKIATSDLSSWPKVISGQERSPAVFQQYLLMTPAKVMKTPQMCSGRPHGSTDMQHDLFRRGHDLDLMSNFQNDLLMSNYSSFDASRQEKHDAVNMNVVLFLSQKLSQKKKTFFAKHVFKTSIIPGLDHKKEVFLL